MDHNQIMLIEFGILSSSSSSDSSDDKEINIIFNKIELN